LLKQLIPITCPTSPYLAQEIKKDLEEKGCKVYITVLPAPNDRRLSHIVWREPDDEDRENGLETEEVEVG